MIFFDQLVVSSVKFEKCYAEFMIPISFQKEFGSVEFVTTIEVTNMRICASKANKMRYIDTIRGTTRNMVGAST